jgi:hypothetical protein
MKKMLLLATAIATVAACGGENGPTQLDVQMLSVSGDVGGTTLDGADVTHVTGMRDGDLGQFFVDEPGLTMQLSACPLGSLETNPYGTAGGPPRTGPDGTPIPTDVHVVPDPSGGNTISGVDCTGLGIFVCREHACAELGPSDVDLQIVEENGWRHLVADGDASGSTVHVDLLYRERR